MAGLMFTSIIYLSLCSLSSASPLWPRQTAPCAGLHQRKAWHDLTDDERADYIVAELCLMHSPSKTNQPLAQNRWDEITVAHQVQTRKPKPSQKP